MSAGKRAFIPFMLNDAIFMGSVCSNLLICASRAGRFATVSFYIEKETPQPQLDDALGFSITKRAPISSSL